MDDRELIAEAIMARQAAYAPYSGFMVGAALLTGDGRVYRGCNIENAAYSPTNCAERTAFFSAIADGAREFRAIAVVGAPKGTKREGFAPCFPCGVCRQVMAEFCAADFRIVTLRGAAESGAGEVISRTLKEQLPDSFSGKNLTL